MSDNSSGVSKRIDFCDYCSRNFPESNLAIINTVINGIEQKERVCPDCEDEARENEKPPARTDGGTSVTKERGYGDTQILVDNLDNSYQQVGDDLKAKVWESNGGERRLYLRVRDSEDRRKFNEFSVDIPRQRDTDN